jgi:hypothetical protein
MKAHFGLLLLEPGTTEEQVAKAKALFVWWYQMKAKNADNPTFLIGVSTAFDCVEVEREVPIYAAVFSENPLPKVRRSQ